MNFGLTEEQEFLKDAARKFLEAQCPPSFVRQMMEDETAHSPAFWGKLAEIGWLGLVYPEEYGGQGGGLMEMVVVAEEIGRAVMPGPFFSTTLLGGLPILAGGKEEIKQEVLPRVAEGNRLLTLAFMEPNGRMDPGGIEALAERRGEDFVLNGVKLFVPDAHVADQWVVAARTSRRAGRDRGITLFLLDRETPGLTCAQLKTVDMTRRLCEISLEGVRVSGDRIIGEVDEGWHLTRKALDQALVAYCAEAVGLSEKTLQMFLAYSKERVQYGQPIGAFQALQHRCADMLVQVEEARSLTYYAAWAVAEDVPEAPTAVAMASACCGETARKVTSEGIQLHGGIGFTWEHDAHLYHRRGIAAELNFGTPSYHREVVAQSLGL